MHFINKVHGYWMNSVGQTAIASNVVTINLNQSTFCHRHVQQETTLSHVHIEMYDVEQIYFYGM
jgi:uncharacterized RmlC-like cupin family protein